MERLIHFCLALFWKGMYKHLQAQVQKYISAVSGSAWSYVYNTVYNLVCLHAYLLIMVS